jgi:hypothetical protein
VAVARFEGGLDDPLRVGRWHLEDAQAELGDRDSVVESDARTSGHIPSFRYLDTNFG